MIDWEKFSINRAVEQTYFSLLTLLGVLNLLAGAFAIFIVATKSPRHTRAYNILLLNILCWSISADFFQTFFAGFENHWPLPCLEPHGIVSFFDIDETVLDVIATLIVTIYCNMIIAAVSPLSFRCFQLSFPNLTSKMATIHWIIYFFCWHGGTTLAAVYLYASCIAPAQYYRNQLAAYPNLHQILHSKLTCVKMNSAETSTMVYSGLAGFSLDAIALLLFFGLSTYLLRKQHKEAKISEKTYKMQKIVTKNLAVVTFVPLLFFTTPFIVYLLAFSTFQLYANYIMGCTELLMCCHDLVVSVVTLTIYSTYRRATLGSPMASCAASASKAALSRLGTVYVSKNRSIFANLAFEEWVFHQHNLEENGDALLVWSNDPAVVVGRHQNPWLEANIPFLDANGIALARRRSGGGTVYHDRGNLNVSLLTSQKQHCRPRNLRRFAESLNRHFGVKIVPNERDDMILQPGDRKISGTAARKAHGRAYHHFTMLVDVDLPFLKKTLKSPWADRIETNATRSVPAKAVGYLGQEVVGVTVEEVQSVVLDTFRSSFEKSVVIESSQVPVDYEKLTWDNVDLREWKWNFGKTPKFTIRLKDGRYNEMRRLFAVAIQHVRGMASCAACSKRLANGVMCSDCGGVQPPNAKISHFEYLGVEERYDIDSGALKRRFLELQNQVHPDKASAVSEDKKQLFEGHSSRLNSAYKILADPVLRAEYMLNAKEDDKSAESPEFLMEMLEKGEEIEHISSDKKLEVTRTQLLEDVERLKTEMADHFSKAKTDEAAATLVRLRYYLRLLSNVNSRLGFDSK